MRNFCDRRLNQRTARVHWLSLFQFLIDDQRKVHSYLSVVLNLLGAQLPGHKGHLSQRRKPNLRLGYGLDLVEILTESQHSSAKRTCLPNSVSQRFSSPKGLYEQSCRIKCGSE